MSIVRTLFKKIITSWINKYRLYCRKRDWRNHALNNISNTVLTKEQKVQIQKYFAPYTKVNSIVHEFYTQKTDDFFVNYIPCDIYFAYIDPYFNDWEKAKIIDNKCMYQELFPNVMQPETVAFRMNDIWLNSSYNILTKENVLELVKRENGLFVKKATESDGGQGVYYYNTKCDFDSIISMINGDIIIQKSVKQHRTLNEINSSSVNTIRVLSLLSKKGVKIYSCVLRIGVNGSRVDNATSGGITCGITREGNLKPVAFSKNGDKFMTHPDTKISFADYSIPGFDEIIKVVPELHCRIPHFRLVSWDFAIDDNLNPILIEANLSYGGLDCHQLNNGPIFGDDTNKILEEVFGKSKSVRK